MPVDREFGKAGLRDSEGGMALETYFKYRNDQEISDQPAKGKVI